MTEQELRESVRAQILQNFENNKQSLIEGSRQKGTISLHELRLLVRKELLRKLTEQAETAEPDVDAAVDQLISLNPQMMAIVAPMLKGEEESKKKSESLVGMGVGLLIGLPGLFHVMAKMASFLAKMLNKIGGNFDAKKEGKTFASWSKKTKKFYVNSIIKPVVKRVFKEQIKGDAKKATVYAEVVYGVLLAAVAVHAGYELVSQGFTGLSSLGNTVKMAFEAAHGAETGLTSAGMMNGLRAAFTAVGETSAVAALRAGSAVASKTV